jgi:hypothetical protein
MAKRRRRDGKNRDREPRPVLFDLDERLGQAPQLVTAGVVTLGLVGAPMADSLCGDDPCVKHHSGGAAILPHNFDIDTVPTRINHVPAISIPIASGGTILR